MTDVDKDQVVIVRQAPATRKEQAIRLLFAISVLLVSVALVALVIAVAILVDRGADEQANDAVEKAQDACYDQYTANVSEGNAAVLAGVAGSVASINGLVEGLAAEPRDQAVIRRLIADGRNAGIRTKASLIRYDAAIDARDHYVAADKPLPCPI
jgi:hypothetical protein